MPITPQLIKDQEFESKFRGFDPIEVKDYLETIADEFFELQEQCKEQEAELQLLHDAKDSSEEYKSSLETDIELTRKISEELKDGCAQKDRKVTELTAEVEELQLRIADMEKESEDYTEEISTVDAGREEAEEALKGVKNENESLRNKIDILQEQNKELKKEEVDFKSTLATAQHFAEDLRKNSRTEADKMIEGAQAEIDQIRDAAQDELERLPKEIAILEEKKQTVKLELKEILENYLETLDVFPADERGETKVEETGAEPEDEELFQKITINDDGSLRPEDVATLASDDGGMGVEDVASLANDDEFTGLEDDVASPAGSEKEPIGNRNMDEDALDSLLRGEKKGDEFDLKEMFSLTTGEDGKQESS